MGTKINMTITTNLDPIKKCYIASINYRGIGTVIISARGITRGKAIVNIKRKIARIDNLLKGL